MSVKICEKPVQTNPFLSYRDPKTGRWVTVKQSSQPKNKKLA
ncbi:MAG: hypothetical protein SXA11_02670 [Cyanobacteriota bacterium]|nr:hypothetical protein [Cyanobacteriota bacterium]